MKLRIRFQPAGHLENRRGVLERGDKLDDVARAGVAVRDPGSQAFHVVNKPQMIFQLFPQHEVVHQLLDRVLALFDRALFDERSDDPLFEKPCAHGALRPIHELPKGDGFGGVGTAFGQLEMLFRVVIHLKDMVLVHFLDLEKMVDVLLLGLFQIPHQQAQRFAHRLVVFGQQLFIVGLQRAFFMGRNQKAVQFRKRRFPSFIHCGIHDDFAHIHFQQRFLQPDERALQLLASKLACTQLAIQNAHFIAIHMNGG